jgi:hypothetical protein
MDDVCDAADVTGEEQTPSATAMRSKEAGRRALEFLERSALVPGAFSVLIPQRGCVAQSTALDYVLGPVVLQGVTTP